MYCGQLLLGELVIYHEFRNDALFIAMFETFRLHGDSKKDGNLNVKCACKLTLIPAAAEMLPFI